MSFPNPFRRSESSFATPLPPTGLIDERHPSPLAIIYRSELDYLSRCIRDYPNIETGGQLFGFWTNQGAPVVLYVIGPGRDANHEQAFFNQDLRYLDLVGNLLLDRYGLQHIGEWHSHHQLGLARPSGHDASTMFHALERVPLRHLLLCIGNYRDGYSAINPYTFHESDPDHYCEALWKVKDMESPFRPIIDRELAQVLIHPRTRELRHGLQRLVSEHAATNSQPAPQGPMLGGVNWLKRTGNIDRLKHIVATVKERYAGLSVQTQMDETGMVNLNIDNGAFEVRFPSRFPQEPPQFLRQGTMMPTPAWSLECQDHDIPFAFDQWWAAFEDHTHDNNPNNPNNPNTPYTPSLFDL